MSRPAGTKLTPEVARELCQRAGSKAYLAGSIAGLGSQYVLGLKAVNCRRGDPLAEEQVTAASKEKVLDAVGEAASKLRVKLGESLVTIKKFDVPLWLTAIQAQLALGRNPTSALTALQPATPPIEFGKSSSSRIFPAFIRPTCAGKLTWQPNKAALLPPSFRRFSTTGASSGIAGRELWRVWAQPAPMPCRPEPRRAGCRRRYRPHPGLQRLSYSLERRRPGRPYSERSQS